MNLPSPLRQAQRAVITEKCAEEIYIRSRIFALRSIL